MTLPAVWFIWRVERAPGTYGPGIIGQRHFNRPVHHPHLKRRQRNGGRRTQHATVANVERRPVQRAHNSRRPQPPLAHSRVRMAADVVERVDAFPGVADDDLFAFEDGRLHAALGNIGQRHGRLERSVGHLF